MTPLNERVREYMDANKYERRHDGEYYDWFRKDVGYLTDELAEVFYLASLQAQKDELHSFIAGGKTIYESSSYSIDGTALAERLAELTKLMETNQPNTTQGGDNDAND